MRGGIIGGLAFALAACATPPAPPEVQAAHFGPVPEAPSAEMLAAAEVVTNYAWLSRPSNADYIMVYPRDAWFKEVQTTVGLDCLVGDDGGVACAADDDGWPQYDFEQAARNLSTRFRLAPYTRDGVPIAGKRIKISVAFRLR